MSRQVTITFDAADPLTLASFWAVAMGYEVQPPPENRSDFVAVVDPAGVGPRLLFLKVPEAKTAKNRVHLDIHCGVEPGAERDAHRSAIAPIVADLVAAGATEHESLEEHGSLWTVLTDPEGNEFCVV